MRSAPCVRATSATRDTAWSRLVTCSVSSPVAMIPCGSLIARPTRRSPQSTARMRDMRSPAGGRLGGRAALHEPAHRAGARELEVHRVHAAAHDEDAAAARVEEVVGRGRITVDLVRVEALPGVVDRDLEAVLEQREVHVDEA